MLSAMAFVAQLAERRTRFAGSVVSSILTEGLRVNKINTHETNTDSSTTTLLNKFNV